ncbi:MAG: hypothetical protein AAGD05_19290, partial [Bacteroidota bacterium]
MEIIKDIGVFIHIGTLCLCLLLMAILWHKKAYYQQSNRYLFLLLLGSVVAHTNGFIALGGYESWHYYSRFFNNAFTLIEGPAIYLALRLRLFPQTPFRKQWAHFLPFFFFSVVLFICLGPLNDQFIYSKRANLIAFFVFLVQFPAYLCLTFWWSRQHRAQIQAGTWTNLNILLAGLWLAYFLQLAALWYDPAYQKLPRYYPVYILLLYSFFTIVFVYRSLLDEAALFGRPKYASSTLPVEACAQIIEQVHTVMTQQQLYLNPHL